MCKRAHLGSKRSGITNKDLLHDRESLSGGRTVSCASTSALRSRAHMGSSMRLQKKLSMRELSHSALSPSERWTSDISRDLTSLLCPSSCWMRSVTLELRMKTRARTAEGATASQPEHGSHRRRTARASRVAAGGAVSEGQIINAHTNAPVHARHEKNTSNSRRALTPPVE